MTEILSDYNKFVGGHYGFNANGQKTVGVYYFGLSLSTYDTYVLLAKLLVFRYSHMTHLTIFKYSYESSSNIFKYS